MCTKSFRALVLSGLMFACAASLLAQGRPYEGPDDPAGDVAAVRKGTMNGNRVYMPFFNNTQLGDFSLDCVAWPNDANKARMHDDIGLLIGARVYIEKDSVPVTDPAIIRQRSDLDTIFYIETHYRGDTKRNPEGTVEWGFYPVFGYFNETSEYPAMSNREESWPVKGWPSRGSELKWPGEWNGRFGRGIKYADLEAYFVANDAQDQKAIQPGLYPRYVPRPGVSIGANSTIQAGRPWGGLGLRVESRIFQWNNPQARDAVFIEYTIANVSNYDLNDVAFGYYMDTGIGGDDPDGDFGTFEKELSMAYAWDYDGVGMGGVRPGIMGIAFLESPGIPTDGVDNDNDGIVDERRDNPATTIVGPMSGIIDSALFRQHYNRTVASHWDSDEDQDWRDGEDANGNGVYDGDEDPGDDVGTDGVGPKDINYTGPDANGTECNHRPDFVEGLGCEPDYDATDIDESDMLGLTMFKMYDFVLTGQYFRNDRLFYDFMTKGGLNEYTGGVTNIAQTFASAAFPLSKGRTERISLAELHSYEDLAGLNSSLHSAPALFQKKRIVQVIYETDYRFLQPPITPTLTAKAGDGKVFLSWNSISDRLTRQPFLKNINDFEGYKLYKATDKFFSDAEQLRDMYGNPAGKVPLYQCDIKDGRKGATDYGVMNGEPFYLGDDTGIKHSFIDNDVQNGRTYYYALCAYNYGLPTSVLGGVTVAPAENNIVVDLDEYENIRMFGPNVQMAVPRQEPAGFVSPQLQVDDAQHLSQRGTINVSVFNQDKVKPNHTYKLKFQINPYDNLRAIAAQRHKTDFAYTTSGVVITDVSDHDSTVYRETSAQYLVDNFAEASATTADGRTITYMGFSPRGLTSDVFDGLQLFLKPSVTTPLLDTLHSGWVTGKAPVHITPNPRGTKYFPWQYDIIFTGSDTSYTSRTNVWAGITSGNDAALGNAVVLLGQKFPFYVINKTFPDSLGNFEKMDLLVHDVNQNKVFDPGIDSILVGPVVKVGAQLRWAGTAFAIDFKSLAAGEWPVKNDVYRVEYTRPYFWGDSLTFTVQAAKTAVPEAMRAGMESIKVVPNPYVMTNMMEPALQNFKYNQRRDLLFTHVPSQCVIKIFTSSGVFVDEIDVENAPDNGTVHWDMLTKESLEIAAGVYFYHVKSKVTGDERMGKFAVIK